jgi:phospholipase C
MMLCKLLLAGFACLAAAASTSPVKYIIVLMMENRSFDHLLGHLKSANPEIDGLDGSQGNPLNPTVPNSPWEPVNNKAIDGGPVDPCHSFDCITIQLFGYSKPVSNKTAPVLMNGFAANAPGGVKNVPFVMSAFNSSNLPVLSTLAMEFAVFDKWHVSSSAGRP